jgi:hypothetical protein
MSEAMAVELLLNAQPGIELKAIEWRVDCPELDHWKQVRFVGPTLRVDQSATRFGESPFEKPASNRTACPLGHVAGLNLLSELHCYRTSYEGADMIATDVAVGSSIGFLVPAPIVVVSGNFGRQLIARKFRGLVLEVAHLD